LRDHYRQIPVVECIFCDSNWRSVVRAGQHDWQHRWWAIFPLTNPCGAVSHCMCLPRSKSYRRAINLRTATPTESRAYLILCSQALRHLISNYGLASRHVLHQPARNIYRDLLPCTNQTSIRTDRRNSHRSDDYFLQ
jgi:hypothetical protein